MAYTLTNLQDDIRSYTEVDSSVLTTGILNTIIKNVENQIYREADSDDNRFYATSNLAAGSRYVTIPSDLRFIRYVQLTDSNGEQTFLEKRDTSYYANWDANYWVVAPTPNSTNLITLAYTKQPDSITASPGSTQGTYTSNKYQDLLLYGCLAETYGYLKGPPDMLQYYQGLYKNSLQSYAIEQQGRRRRDEWQDGAIRTPLKSESPSKY